MNRGFENDIGERIGRIRVLRKLADGGMGRVFLGQDESLERTVVLKAIRDRYRLDADARLRFRREAKILSQLDHPHICKVFDLVTNDGQDFLVLEFVEGRNLREVLDDGLDRGSALSVARQLLEVLVAVHAQGVIHRDLKPENVMVGDDGEIKVLDFGLARLERELTASDASADTSCVVERMPEASDSLAGDAGDSLRIPDGTAGLTRRGALIGTVRYMSPEQARGEPATAASDVYAFGLMLQEMLTGRPPFPAELDRSIVRRRVMWGDLEPPAGLPPELSRFIERLTSLEPSTRPTAVDAVEMLRHFAEGPRRRRRLLTVAATWIILVVFGAGMTVQYLRAEQETRRAEQERQATQHVADFLVGLFEVADNSRDPRGDVSARQIVDEGTRRIEAELGGQPLVKARLMHTLGRVYHGLGMYDPASHMLWQAAQIRSHVLGERHPDVAESLLELGRVHRDAGRWGHCEMALNQAIQILAATGPAADLDAVRGKSNLSVCLARLGRVDDALEVSEEVQAAVQADAAEFDGVSDDLMTSRASVLQAAGRLDEAEHLYLEILETHRAESGGTPVEVTLNNLGFLQRVRGNMASAEAYYREALGILDQKVVPYHPRRIQVLQNLATVLHEQGKLEATEDTLVEVVRLRREAYPDGYETVGTALVLGLGRFYLQNQRFDDATTAFEEGLQVLSNASNNNPYWASYAQGMLAAALSGLGREQEATGLVAESTASLEKLGPFSQPFVSQLEFLIRDLESSGRPDLAQRYRVLIIGSVPDG